MNGAYLIYPVLAAFAIGCVLYYYIKERRWEKEA